MYKYPHVHQFVDRHGKVRRYFRRRGYKQVRLIGSPGSPAFMAAYAAALTGGEPVKPEPRAGVGTFGRLVNDYYASADFQNLKPSSQRVYRIVLEKWNEKHGHRLVRDLTRAKARELIGHVAEGSGTGMANQTATVLKVMMKMAVDTGVRADNPFGGLKRYKQKKEHRDWAEAELAAYEKRWPLGTRERLAYDLLLYLGQRIGDVSKLTRANLKDDHINLVQEKTGAPLSLRIHAKLAQSIRQTPAKGLSLIGNAKGQPISRQMVYKMMIRAAKEAGLPRDCTPHGLRKAMSRRLGDNGATNKMIMAVTGHRTSAQVDLYTRGVDQVKLSDAAIGLLK